MKLKYTIGFFCAVIVVFLLVTVGYQVSYQSVTGRQDAGSGQVLREESIAAEGKAEKGTNPDPSEASEEKGADQGYVLRDLHGFVAVYQIDGSSIYEITDIHSADLPEEVRQEIAEGKRIRTEKELYAFLENYSS